jgi:hypothetical protein
MTEQAAQPDLLPTTLPTGVVVALALISLALWAWTHRYARLRRGKLAGWATLALRSAVGTGSLWLVFNALARFLLLSTTWPLWLPALLGGVAIESILSFYTMERRSLSRAAGITLAALRLALTALVVAMLIQPVIAWDIRRTEERYVAILLDSSESMEFVDQQASVTEKMRLAQIFSPELMAVPISIDQRLEELATLQQDLGSHVAWLALLAGADSAMINRQIDRRRPELTRQLDGAREEIRAQVQVLADGRIARLKLPDALRDRLTVAKKTLESEIIAALEAARTVISATPAEQLALNYQKILTPLRQAEGLIGRVVKALPGLALQVEAAYFNSLTPEEQKAIDEAVERSRRAVIRSVLLARRGETPSLVEQIDRNYVLRLYRFADRTLEAGREALEETAGARATSPPAGVSPRPGGGGTSPPATASIGPEATDITAALEQVRQDLPLEKLAGVLILSDGRHNARQSPEAAARILGVQRVPVCSVLIGSTVPPADAAVTGVVGPKSVQLKDRVVLRAGLKLDGLRGKKAVVRLKLGDEVLDEKTVAIPADRYRPSVEFADTPKDEGVRSYQVTIEPIRGEAVQSNNTRAFDVAVTDAPTHLLLIEGRPRWEARYLRNLFANRDKSVRLQYVLLQPDRIDGVDAPPKVHASTSRDSGMVEANALPKDENEWMAFDAIILGDIPPEHLPQETLEILERFVGERGGRLIVIAGPLHMPHAYHSTPIEAMVPMTFAASSEPMIASIDPQFRIALTEAGREHVVMRQSDDPVENQERWDAVPEIHWRYPVTGTKSGAEVLAFALPENPPEEINPPVGGSVSEMEQFLRRREAFARQAPLLALHRYARGWVMMLGFDRTWRLRYRVGDIRHHKFWGQVLRWASADKLQVGTDRIRLGTNQTLYDPDEPVHIKAKLTREDHSPVISQQVAVNVYSGERRVLRKPLDYVAASAGIYEAELGVLPPGGRYRIELDVKGAGLADLEAAKVSTEVVVSPAQADELTELSADRAVLDQLAALTGGAVATPADAADLVKRLGPGTHTVTEAKHYLLWNSWPLLLTIIAVATVEWILRKRWGLL